jgi:hypothetical protein
MDLTKLTDEELMLLERIVIKAQRPLPDGTATEIDDRAVGVGWTKQHVRKLFD